MRSSRRCSPCRRRSPSARRRPRSPSVGAPRAAPPSRRVAHEIGLLVCSLGVVLADVALALALDGAPRVVAYGGGAVAFAALARSLRTAGIDERLLGAGLGGHLCLAVLEALTGPARP